MAKIGPGGSVAEIELCPDNRSYRSARLSASDGDIRVVAEFLEVLG